jgi:polyisoprenyl-phosphate glycosyltransferase
VPGASSGLIRIEYLRGYTLRQLHLMKFPLTLSLSVVAACFNEEEVLPEFLRRTRAACEVTGRPFEVILIDDGSRDNTWTIIVEAAAQDSRIRGLRLFRNHGHQVAITAGLHAASGDRVVVIDADLQDPPELLVDMLSLMDREKADVVYGQRRRRMGETAFKRWTAKIFYRLINALSDVDIPPDTGDFRLMRRNVVDFLRNMPEQHRFIRGMVSWIGGRQVPLMYDRDQRYAGRTQYPLKRMTRLAIDALTGFSRRPLALASYCGFGASLCSLVLGLWSLLGWVLGMTVPGWASLMAAFGMLMSLQFLFLGLLGEYIGRLYEDSRGRPLFLLSMTVGEGLASQATAPITDFNSENPA